MIAQGKKVFFVNGKFWHDYRVLKKALKGVSIVHKHFFENFRWTLLLKMYAPHAKLIQHIHMMPGVGRNARNLIWKFARAIVRRMEYKMIDRFCAVSVPAREELEKKYPFVKEKKKIFCIENGIDFKRLEERKSDYTIEKKKELWGGSFLLLLCGTDFLRKGADVALKAVEKLVNQKIDVKLLFVTNNETRTEKEITDMFGRLPEFVSILPVIENVGAYYSLADLCLVPSRSDSFCTVVPESIYCGTLVVRSDLESMNRHVPNDFVVGVGDVEGLESCIKEIICMSEGQRKLIVQLQKKVVTETCGIDKWVSSVIEMYQDVLGETH